MGRNLVLVLIFGFGIALGLIAGAAYLERPQYHYRSDKKIAAIEEEHPKWTDKAIVFLTIAIVIGTGGMWIVTDRTLRQTKRSVDAYVQAERGHFAAGQPVAQDPILDSYIYWLVEVENVGRSGATVVEMGGQVVWRIGSDTTTPDPSPPLEKVDIWVPPGGRTSVVLEERPNQTGSTLARREFHTKVRYKSLGDEFWLRHLHVEMSSGAIMTAIARIEGPK